ncbi:hypothetical protein IWQ60_003650 [Tieghemiomyces parasiticus]|uniref:Mating factor alpha n=1 Tax=Tieghemiomyces parasiticus TaxID=78921 RepID=A0A9W8A984_9FUNG|nr:hypothetical protein IWQ60_003650 [Tieghemiomyces parasiticus]
MLCPVLVVALVATQTVWAQPSQLAPVGSSIDSFGSSVLETYDDNAQVPSTEAKFPRISKSNWGSRRDSNLGDDDYSLAINAIEEMNTKKTPDYRWGSAQAVSQDQDEGNDSESLVDLEKRRGGGRGGGGGGGNGGSSRRKKSDGSHGVPIPGYYQYLNPSYWRPNPEI